MYLLWLLVTIKNCDSLKCSTASFPSNFETLLSLHITCVISEIVKKRSLKHALVYKAYTLTCLSEQLLIKSESKLCKKIAWQCYWASMLYMWMQQWLTSRLTFDKKARRVFCGRHEPAYKDVVLLLEELNGMEKHMFWKFSQAIRELCYLENVMFTSLPYLGLTHCISMTVTTAFGLRDTWGAAYNLFPCSLLFQSFLSKVKTLGPSVFGDEGKNVFAPGQRYHSAFPICI